MRLLGSDVRDPLFANTPLAVRFAADLEDLFAEINDPLDNRYRFSHPSPQATHFFKHLYVRDSELREVRTDGVELRLSDLETELFRYCSKTAPRSVRGLVIKGHAGVGKSTLVKTFIFALYPSMPVLQRAFVPVYVNAHDERQLFATASAAELKRAMLEEVQTTTYQTVRDVIQHYGPAEQENCEQWLRANSLIGDIQKAASRGSTPGTLWALLCELLDRDHREARSEAMFLFSSVRPISLFLDDVDFFDAAVYEHVFELVDSLWRKGLKSVVTVRDSTYALINVRNHVFDAEQEVQSNAKRVTTILKRRVARVKGRVHLALSSGAPTAAVGAGAFVAAAPRVETSKRHVLEYLLESLERPDVLEFLTGTSNGNMKSVRVKLTWLLSSRYADEGRLARRELAAAVPAAEAPLAFPAWAVYSGFMANRYLTYVPDRDNIKVGLVNLFGAGEELPAPWRYFARLHVLAFAAYSAQRGGTSDFGFDECVKVLEYTYGSPGGAANAVRTAIAHCLQVLLESHLVFSLQCRLYESADDLAERSVDDRFKISDAGKYYLTSLVGVVEYLYFCKDSVEWSPDDFSQVRKTGMRRAEPEAGMLLKARAWAKAVERLAHAEVAMFEKIKGVRRVTSDGVEPLAVYVEKLSPLVLDRGSRSLLFTAQILDVAVSYLNRQQKDMIEDPEVAASVNSARNLVEGCITGHLDYL